MTRLCWWLVDILCRSLQPGERDAVRGDIQERGETASEALRDVLGLVLFRQLELWKSWGPWLALVALVLPSAMLLGRRSSYTADHSAIYIWLYVNNWDRTFFTNAGYRHDLAHFGGEAFLSYLVLVCWSWLFGLTLRLLASGAAYVNGAFFSIALLCTSPAVLHRARDFSNNAAVFELTFYRAIFPVIVQTVLVLLPALWGTQYITRRNHEG